MKGGRLAALQNRNFRLYWSGQLVSQLGTWMQTVALSWLVLRLSNSPKALGEVLAFQFVPSLLFSLPGGALADRLDKRRLLMATQSVQLLQAALLATVAFLPHPRLEWLYLLALVAGTALACDGPARQAFVPELVSADELPTAIALNSAQFNLSRVIGPALGGLVVSRWGEAACFALNAASFLAVLLALGAIRPMEKGAARPRGSVADGLRFVRSSPDLTLIMLLAALMGAFGLQFNVILPLVAKYQLQTGSAGFGLLTALVGLGSLACALAIAVLGRGGRRLLVLGSLSLGLSLVGLARSTQPAPIYAWLFLWGFTDIMFFNTAMISMQLLTPADLRGRVNSLYLLLVTGTAPIGSLVIGSLATHLSVTRSIEVTGHLCLVGTLLAALVYWTTSRAAR